MWFELLLVPTQRRFAVRFSRPLTNVMKATGVTVALLAGLVVGGSPAGAEAPAPDNDAAAFEVHFMKAMIDHHGMAVHTANRCVEVTTNPELKVLCQKMASDQASEIASMQMWLNDWYGVQYEHMGSPQMHESMGRVFTATGEEFDMIFLRHMIRHHFRAIPEADRCVKNAYHEELRNLCSGIFSLQLSEIGQMKAWLAQWFGRPDYEPKSQKRAESLGLWPASAAG